MQFKPQVPDPVLDVCVRKPMMDPPTERGQHLVGLDHDESAAQSQPGGGDGALRREHHLGVQAKRHREHPICTGHGRLVNTTIAGLCSLLFV
jgi:hypothetical protein